MWLATFLLGLGAALSIVTSHANATVIYAGDGEALTLSQAIDIANASPGTTIYVEPGTYTDMLPNILATMTIQQDPASASPLGSVILDSPPTGEKGILTVEGAAASLAVSGLTFENAAIPTADGGNGAGIRDQSSGFTTLTILNSFFLSNQDGVLTNNPNETVRVTDSIFENNGSFDGFEHALYVSGGISLTVSGSTFCGTTFGHDIKSRTQNTTILNSLIYDGAPDAALGCAAGTTSFGIDLPNGGNAIIDSDQIIQGARTDNNTMVRYGEEGMIFLDNSFIVSNTNFISTDVHTSIGIRETTCVVPVQLSNDTFRGVDIPVSPVGCVVIAPVPEPQTIWLLLTALGGFAAFFSPLLRGRNLSA